MFDQITDVLAELDIETPEMKLLETELGKALLNAALKVSNKRARVAELANQVDEITAKVRREMAGSAVWKGSQLGALQSTGQQFELACAQLATLVENATTLAELVKKAA